MGNVALAHAIIEQIAKSREEDPKTLYALLEHIDDRPGHDLRYALSSEKIRCELQWKPQYDFVNGLKKTVKWYLGHQI